MAELWSRVLKVLVIGAWFCALAFAQNSSGGPARPDDIAQKAEAAQQAGRPEEAIGLYRRGLEANPAWADGWWHLALLWYDQGKCVEAEEADRHFIAMYPESGPAHALMGVCLYNNGEFDKALDNLQRAPERSLSGNKALFRSVCYYTALVMIRKSQFGSAIDTLQSFADDHDDSQDALLALGLAMLRVPVPPEELNPAKKDLVLRSGRAAFLAGEHRYPEAEREYRALLAAYPHTPNVHYEYGTYLFSSTFYERAIAEFKQELQLFPHTPLPNIYLALTYLKIGRSSEALSYAQEAVALDPTTYAAQCALGQSLLKTGDFQGAIKHLEVAAKLDPSNPEVHYALIIAYGRVGRKTDSEREQAIFQQLKKSGAGEKKGGSFMHQPEADGLGNNN